MAYSPKRATQGGKIPSPAPPQQGPEAPSIGKTPPARPDAQLTRPEPKGLVPETGLDYCQQLEADVAEFFKYLDTRDYVRHLELGTPTLNHFKKLLAKLSTHPPVPAGEGIDPRLLTKNIYHFYRALGRKDLRLIREILKNESDTMEINLEIFFRWAMATQCPDNLGLRPSFDVLYKYAGFLLNTIGGRAYLARRAPTLRLLLSYYCLLIIHEADKRGKNSYGIDPYPFLDPLREEISHYPDLEFQADYLKSLEKVEAYYLQKR